MKKYSREFSVGLFVLAGLLCLAYLTIKLGKMEIMDDNSYTISARFTSITGLKVGAGVEVAGVPVGKVSAIRLGKDASAVVSMRVRNGVLISDDSTAAVRTSGLIGDKYISVALGDSHKYLGPDGVVEDTSPAVNIEDVIGNSIFGRMDVTVNDGYTLRARFSSVTGLRTGASVEIAGVPVGRVAGISLSDHAYALVTLHILKGVAVPEDSIASVKTSGLIGNKYISLSPGASDTLLADGAQMEETTPSVDIEELISKYVFGGVK